MTVRPKFAVVAPVGAGVTADPLRMTEFAQHPEACGFESIVAVEHTVLMTKYSSVCPYDESGRSAIPTDCSVPDPLDLLAFLAARTRLGLATSVWPNESHPSTRCLGAECVSPFCRRVRNVWR